jgi:hypothetical protein
VGNYTITYRHGQGLQEWLLWHEQTVNAIANVVHIWLMDSPSFTVEYDDSGNVEFTYLSSGYVLQLCFKFWLQFGYKDIDM